PCSRMPHVLTHSSAVTGPLSRLPTFSCAARAPRPLPSFPTRRSSDLTGPVRPLAAAHGPVGSARGGVRLRDVPGADGRPRYRVGDRKSTRLNSSHVSSSYAVFCLKKKP